MSYHSSIAGMFMVHSPGNIGHVFANSAGGGVYPVVSLKSTTLMGGSGQWNDPYIVED